MMKSRSLLPIALKGRSPLGLVTQKVACREQEAGAVEL